MYSQSSGSSADREKRKGIGVRSNSSLTSQVVAIVALEPALQFQTDS